MYCLRIMLHDRDTFNSAFRQCKKACGSIVEEMSTRFFEKRLKIVRGRKDFVKNKNRIIFLIFFF